MDAERTESASPALPASTQRRISLVLDIASETRTPMRWPELLALLPAGTPGESVRDWLLAAGADTAARAWPDGMVVDPGSPAEERAARTDRYLEAAQALVGAGASWPFGWVRCVCVTGSTAYGTPSDGDDLDLFVVVREGAVWAFLAAAYLRLRWNAMRAEGTESPYLCVNYVVDDRTAPEELGRPSGFLLAREALTARPVLGAPYYRRLLGSAGWMGEEAPGLFHERAEPGEAPPTDPAPWPVRLISAAVFLPLAAYLQLVGLRRSRVWTDAQGRPDPFRTESTFRRLAFGSERFDALRNRYASAGGGASGSAPTARNPSGAGGGPIPTASTLRTP